ncbi:MAG: tol-pal system protein YbgF [Limnohabitans sp.]
MRLNFRSTAVELACALALGAVAGSAHAALFEDDDARRAILDLRQRVEQTNKSLTEENAQLRRSLLDLQAQIESLRSDVSQIRGAHEGLARDVSEIQQRQKDVAAGVDERLRKFEPTKVSLDGREFLAEPAEKRDYEAAMETFRKGDFVAAQGALAQFVQRNGKSGYVPSALFWLGNAQYANKSYKESMANFQQMLNLAPAHARAPEALLAISNVQSELKDIKGARKTLDDLIKAYPSSEAATTARERLARLR